MRTTAPWLMALTVMACGGEDPLAPAPDDGPAWEPFVHGEASEGVQGVARFQIAPCAYAEMVERLPTCALDLALVTGHRTALNVLLPEGAFAFESSDPAVLQIDDARPTARADILRVDIHALAPGDVALQVRAGGAGVDSVTVRVRPAASVDISRDGVSLLGPLEIAVGSELALRATARDAGGAPLNAWSEIDWTLAAGDALRAIEQRGTELRLSAERAGDVRIDSAVGDALASLAVVVE